MHFSTVLCELQLLTFMDKSYRFLRAGATQESECVYLKPHPDRHTHRVHISWRALYYLQTLRFATAIKGSCCQGMTEGLGCSAVQEVNVKNKPICKTDWVVEAGNRG